MSWVMKQAWFQIADKAMYELSCNSRATYAYEAHINIKRGLQAAIVRWRQEIRHS